VAMGRLIHRDFFTSPDLTDLPAAARLMFAGMIVHADDAGIIRDQPVLFARLYCFGLDVRPCRVRAWLDTLMCRKCIQSVFLEDVKCWRITNFAQFQRLKRREGKRREDVGGTGPPSVVILPASPGEERPVKRPDETFKQFDRRVELWEHEVQEAARRRIEAEERAERLAPVGDVPTAQEAQELAGKVRTRLKAMNGNGGPRM